MFLFLRQKPINTLEQIDSGVYLADSESSWWKKAAENVVDTVKDKLAKKEPVIEPNFGKTHPQVLSCVKEKFRVDVIHIWELGKFRSENQELSCYGVIFKGESAIDGMSSFRSIFIAYGTEKVQFAVAHYPVLLREELFRNFISSELNVLSSAYMIYKEFASTKPWVKFDYRAFEEFKLSKEKLKPAK